MIKDKYSLRALQDTSLEYDVSIAETEKVHDLMFKFIREVIVKLDYKNMSNEEFDNAKKIFNITGLGKLYPRKRYWKKLNEINKNREKKY